MHYMIDFDKWLVHARHENKDVLAKYGDDSEMLLGMEIVSNTEELCLVVDINEISKIHHNLTGIEGTFFDEEDAAEALWIAMEEHANDIPEVDNGTIIKIETKVEDDDDWDEEPEQPVKQVKPVKKKGVRAKELMDKTFCLGSKTPRKGTTFAILTDFIEGQMSEATFDELVKEFMDKYKPSGKTVCDEKFASGYIRGAFNAEYIEESL